MKTLFVKLFIENWHRKAVSFLLGMLIWLTVNHSLTTTKTLTNVPVRIVNLPLDQTIEGMQGNGRLNKKLNLILIGNINTLNELNATDVEIVIDAAGKTGQWEAPISKKNLVSLNTEIDIAKGISKIYHPSLLLRMAKLITEKIPIIITHPIGEAPRGYQFLDIWPYRLSLSISGPEDVIKRLKLKEQKITFNLNDISKAQLDAIANNQPGKISDVISFIVPKQWKQINIPLLSDLPFELDEIQEQSLRIDFLRCSLVPLDSPVFVSLFYMPEYASIYNPLTLRIRPNAVVEEMHGIFMLRPFLYAKGCDRLFVQVVKNRVQITFITIPSTQRKILDCGIQFINSSQLEQEYVSTLMSDTSDENIQSMKPSMREEYLRNRFRSYMNRFSLYSSKDKKFELSAKINGSFVDIEEQFDTLP